jgi:hypothetical protein
LRSVDLGGCYRSTEGARVVPGASWREIFPAKAVDTSEQTKKEQKKPKGSLVETDAADGNPLNPADSPSGLESTKRFPQFPQGSAAAVLTQFKSQRFHLRDRSFWSERWGATDNASQQGSS